MTNRALSTFSILKCSNVHMSHNQVLGERETHSECQRCFPVASLLLQMFEIPKTGWSWSQELGSISRFPRQRTVTHLQKPLAAASQRCTWTGSCNCTARNWVLNPQTWVMSVANGIFNPSARYSSQTFSFNSIYHAFLKYSYVSKRLI